MKGLQNVKPGLGATTYAQSKLQSSVVLRVLDTFKGGFQGPMISDVRDYYIDNIRFPTL